MQLAARQLTWTDEVYLGGTVLELLVAAPSLTAVVAGGALAPGSKTVRVRWGDGTPPVDYDRLASASHTYAQPGRYLVRISDDLSSFAYVASGASDTVRQMLRRVWGVGLKVTSIGGYGFNNCHAVAGTLSLPSVTSIGGYALGSTTSLESIEAPALAHVVQTSFYAGCGARALHVDKATEIDPYLFEYYGGALEDLHIRGKSCAEIRAMPGFPFAAGPAVRFHGRDGVITRDA